MRIPVVVALFLPLIPAGAQAPPPLSALLPAGAVTAEVLDWTAPPRAVDLLARFEAAVTARPEWFAELRQRTPASGALPWQPGMGLERDEYAEMLGLLGQLDLVRRGTASLVVGEMGSTLRLVGEGHAAPLNGLSIDLARGVVVSPFGSCKALEPSSGRVGGLGAWTGYACRAEVPGPSLDVRNRLDLRLGRLAEDGSSLVFYEGLRTFRGVTQERVGVYLRVPVAGSTQVASH